MRYISCIIISKTWLVTEFILFFVHIRMAPWPRIPFTSIYWSSAPSVQPRRVSILEQFFTFVQEQGEKRQPDTLKATQRPHVTCEKKLWLFSLTLLMGWKEVWGEPGFTTWLMNWVHQDERKTAQTNKLLMWGVMWSSAGLKNYSLEDLRPGSRILTWHMDDLGLDSSTSIWVYMLYPAKRLYNQLKGEMKQSH